jgi:trans-2,3-dihydro-3-hydroxyanthranilate isomerase
MSYEFLVVNSFTSLPFGGNPAAVFPNAENLSKDSMQRIAKQLNLVETVFITGTSLDQADFRLRYFTPNEELPVAGHPTIAAIRALIEVGDIDLSQRKTFNIVTAAGKQAISIDGSNDDPVVVMKQPKPEYYPIIQDRQIIANILGITELDLISDLPIHPINTGLGHIIVPVRSLKALMAIRRDIQPLRAICEQYGMREIQAFTFETYEEEADLHTRNICPREGIEDPGCGIGNGALGAYLLKHRFKEQLNLHLKAEQGVVVNMPCLINIYGSYSKEEIDIAVGGSGIVMIKGKFYEN